MKRNGKSPRVKTVKSGKKPEKCGCGKDHSQTAEEAMRIGAKLTTSVLMSLALQVPDLAVQMGATAELVAMLTASVARSAQLMDPRMRVSYLELVNERLAHHFQAAKVDAAIALRS